MGYGRWADFEELDDEALNELKGILSDDAIRQGAYGDGNIWGDGETDESLQNLENEWQRAIKIRWDAVSILYVFSDGEMAEMFPYRS
jgi:hypothetical protein